jgi:hypothetical protein
MRSRVMTKVMSCGSAPRFTFTVTLVPFLPRSRFWIALLLIFTPAMAVSFTITMRSPGKMPTRSDGPPATVCIT